ncbi:MAG: alpha/beta hydrolase [Flavobacterium sp.]|nr:alpha/beta hydrolase [Pedobacter sp.]
MALNKFFIICSVIFPLLNSSTFSQTVIPLYPDGTPNSKRSLDAETSQINTDGILIVSKVSRPTLSMYLPSKKTKAIAAVIICPGGGYSVLAAGHEGADVAKRFNEMGIAAFVLKYRIPDTETMVNKSIAPLQDAQRAIQMVRENAKIYGVNADKIGIMGFSAGGHLASTAGTHFEKAYIDNPRKTSLRPDFMILVYPVITFTQDFTHTGSRDHLLGKDAAPDLIKQFSNELQVTSETPPTFLVHAKDDEVSVQNSIAFANALKKNKVPVELYLYEKGGHGYGMYNKTSEVKWMDLVGKWMKEMKFVFK